jgi:hypothetical protein
VTTAQRDQLKAERGRRALPKTLTSTSAVLLERVDALICGEAGIGYEVNKLLDWLERFPLATEENRRLARLELWQTWPSGKVNDIADAVMLGGYSPARVAVEHGTTRETVEDIVYTRREAIRRTRERY